jgi:flavorubredoxin
MGIVTPSAQGDTSVKPQTPPTQPHALGPDTWLIPRLAPAGPKGFVYLNSLLIRGEEPIIVDTGAAVHRAEWQEDVFSLVDPGDVRWIFLSHEDADHVGNLAVLLEMCPNATIAADFLSFMKIGVLYGLPPQRTRWLNPGEHLDAGDRTLTVFRPPLLDSASSRGVIDTSTGIMWAADSFAGPTPAAVFDAGDLPPGMWAETFMEMNSLENPWHQWADPKVFGAHIDSVSALRPRIVASCHGPVLRGGYIADAFELTRSLAGAPPHPTPGQETLDQIIADAMAAAS